MSLFPNMFTERTRDDVFVATPQLAKRSLRAREVLARDGVKHARCSGPAQPGCPPPNRLSSLPVFGSPVVGQLVLASRWSVSRGLRVPGKQAVASTIPPRHTPLTQRNMSAHTVVPPCHILTPTALPGYRMKYPPCEKHDSGMMKVSAVHTVYWEVSGNPDGKPA